MAVHAKQVVRTARRKDGNSRGILSKISQKFEYREDENSTNEYTTQAPQNEVKYGD